MNVTLSFAAPPSLGVYDAGASVPVQVNARLGDGGAYVVMVPLTSSFGTNTTVTSGVASSLSIPTVAGQHRLTAGWDGGPFESVSVVGTSCVASCQPWQTCRATIDGGACDSLNLTLTWTSPDAGLPFNTASVPARLSVTRSGPVPASLTSVPLFGPLGPASPLSGGSGVFTGSLPMAAPEGNKTFIAGWPDGGPTASVTIERDTVAPGVVLTVLRRDDFGLPDPDPRSGAIWKKNETAIVRAVVDGGRAVTVADLNIVDSGVIIAPAPSTSCGCSSGTCSCFQVPLLSANEGLVRPSVVAALIRAAPISDQAGNLSEPVVGEILVSRFLWSRQPPGTAPKLALSESGLLLVNSWFGNASTLQAIAPDGGTLWSWSSPSGSVSRPVVGSSLVYVTVQESDGTSSIKAVSLATGTLSTTLCEANVDSPFREPIALATTITGTEIPLAFRKGVIVAATGSCPSSEQFDAFAFGGIATQREGGGELGAYFIGSTALRKLVFSGFGFEDGGVGAANADDLWMAPGVVGWSANGASILNVASATQLSAPFSMVGTQASARAPLIGSDAAWFIRASGIERCGFDTSFIFNPNCVVSPFPFVATPQESVKTVGGFITGRDPGLFEANEVGGISYSYGQAGTELLVDVPRGPTGAKACGAALGIAYMVDTTGAVVATLVNAQGLDGTAFWPRARHDNANSSNFNRSLAPWSCP